MAEPFLANLAMCTHTALTRCTFTLSDLSMSWLDPGSAAQGCYMCAAKHHPPAHSPPAVAYANHPVPYYHPFQTAQVHLRMSWLDPSQLPEGALGVLQQRLREACPELHVTRHTVS